MNTPAQALAAGPIAIAPTPPPHPPPGKTATRSAPAADVPTTRARSTSTARQILLGVEHARTVVTVVISATTVNVFHHRGQHIRSVVIVPGKTYYSNGPTQNLAPKPEVSTLT